MASDDALGHLVVFGASTGGIEALLAVARSLPAGFPAPLCVVQHIGANPSILPELLSNSGPHPAVHARDRQVLTAGVFHVAPPDHHLLVEDGRLRLSRSPRENHTRPAVDPLFRSAALAWGARTIGVVLSGALDDGTAGLYAIKERGGVAIVQDPATAEQPDMPGSALAFVDVDFTAAPQDIGPLLGRLVGRLPAEERPPEPTLEHEAAINRGEDLVRNLEAIAQPAGLSCPDCGGGLWEVRDAQLLLRRMATVADAVGDAGQAEAARRQAGRLQAQVRQLRDFTGSVEGEEA